MPDGPAVPVWDRGDDVELAPLVGEVHADVCVVGLGGSGLTTIDALLDLGATVVGLDARGVASGAAGRNGGLLLAGIAPFYHDAIAALGRERARALYVATLDEQRRIAERAPTRVRRTQSLRIEDDAAGLEDCARHRDALRADGFRVMDYHGPEGRGLRLPTDLSFDPMGRCRDLARDVIARGARLFGGTRAEDIAGDRVVTSLGVARAGTVVVAVDGGLERVLPELAGRVRTARLQMLATAPADDVSLPIPMYLRDGYEYVQKLPGGELALGGFRDRFVDDEWTHEKTPTAAIQDLLDGFLRDRVGSNAAVTHRWAASVGYVDGPLPICEEVRERVWAIGGYSGTGNLVGALCGRAVAALALGRTNELSELLRSTP